MIGSKTFFIALVLSVLIAFTCAAIWERNETSFPLAIDEHNDVPIPGITWLERIVAPTEMTLNGITFPSAFSAILNGSPLDHPCRNLNAYVNSYFFADSSMAFFIEKLGVDWAHYVACYLRNFIGGMLLYYATSFAFHYYYYIHPRSKKIFANRERPSWDTIKDQIKLSQASLLIYVMHPLVDEYLVENGYTLCYFTVKEIGGWIPFTAWTIVYFAMVEIGIYWMHRTLHTNKFLYKHVHLMHHKYNKPHTLTPWAGLAFHPLDGILQACPYIISLLFVPCHYGFHFFMIFLTAIWATYIHDAMDFNIDPIMGSKYHTVHHTHYIYNYGQVFTFCDRFWGTFKEPDGPTGVKVRKAVTKKID